MNCNTGLFILHWGPVYSDLFTFLSDIRDAAQRSIFYLWKIGLFSLFYADMHSMKGQTTASENFSVNPTLENNVWSGRFSTR